MTSFAGTLRRLRDRLVPQAAPTGGPAILMYHRIADETFDPWGLAVSPENFAEQVRWLADNRRILGLVEFASLHRGKALPEDGIAITFDDGYASVIEEAAPILEQSDAPATVFISADLIEAGRESWWDELRRIVLHHPGPSLDAEGTVELGDRSPTDSRWDPGDEPQTPRQRVFLSLWERLKAHPPEAQGEAMASLRQQAGDAAAARPTHRLLTSDELRRRPRLLDVGSHALTHPSLPLLPRLEKEREIRDSVARCEDVAGTPPRTFAYPFGDIDRESMNMVRDAGFECACTTQHSFVTRRTNPFSLPRLAVPNCSAADLASLLGTP